MNLSNLKLSLVLVLVSAAFFGCSTAKVRILPGADSNRVVVRDIERDGAEEAAAKAASEYCTKRGKELEYIGDETKYTGDMDESTRQLVRNGSRAAMLLGSAGRVTPGYAGGPSALLGSAGTVGYSMTSNRDYQASMEFKCR